MSWETFKLCDLLLLILEVLRNLFHPQDLIKELKSELGGKLKQTVIAMCDKPDVYDANELRKAMKVQKD